MTDRPLRGRIAGSKTVAELAARVAVETPGVLRLEPSLGRLLMRLGAAARNGLRGIPEPGSLTSRAGVFAAVSAGRATIDLEVATDARFNAVRVAADLQERVRQALEHTGVATAAINVTVLAIEEPPPVPRFPGR